MNAVEIFLNIRDLPYTIPLSQEDKDSCCNGKSLMLKSQLEALGYSCRFRVCSFFWNSLGLPQEIMSLPHTQKSTHVWLEVLIDDRWIDLDPTWDSGLKSVFEINSWDGKTSTKVAVPILETFSLTKSEGIMNGSIPDEPEEAFETNKIFYQALNQRLAKCRNTP